MIDPSTLVEIVCWGIAVLCSTAALMLALLAPEPAAIAHASRRRKKQRDDLPSLYRPIQLGRTG